MHPDRPIISLKEIARIQTGDLVFRRGRDLDSHLVIEAEGSGQYSHVGLAWVQNKKVYIVHALPDENGTKNGVIVEPIELFSAESKASGVGIYRMHSVSPSVLKNVVAYAISFKGRPFDTDFDISNQDRLYCTELVWLAYSHFGLRLVTSFDHLRFLMKSEIYILPSSIQKAQDVSELFQISQ